MCRGGDGAALTEGARAMGPRGGVASAPTAAPRAAPMAMGDGLGEPPAAASATIADAPCRIRRADCRSMPSLRLITTDYTLLTYEH